MTNLQVKQAPPPHNPVYSTPKIDDNKISQVSYPICNFGCPQVYHQHLPYTFSIPNSQQKFGFAMNSSVELARCCFDQGEDKPILLIFLLYNSDTNFHL